MLLSLGETFSKVDMDAVNGMLGMGFRFLVSHASFAVNADKKVSAIVHLFPVGIIVTLLDYCEEYEEIRSVM